MSCTGSSESGSMIPPPLVLNDSWQRHLGHTPQPSPFPFKVKVADIFLVGDAPAPAVLQATMTLVHGLMKVPLGCYQPFILK